MERILVLNADEPPTCEQPIARIALATLFTQLYPRQRAWTRTRRAIELEECSPRTGTGASSRREA